MTIIGVYAPIEGEDVASENLYSLLQEITDKVNRSDYLVIL